MNVSGLGANKNLIDQSSINKVSLDLFQTLQKKSVDYAKADLSKFQRPTLGVDLYNGKTNINTQRQIAMTNAGVFEQNLNLTSVQALNSFAAQQLYAGNVQDTVGGKMTINTNEADFEFISEVEDVSNVINVFETSKDKQGSNPFFFGNFFSQESKKEEN